MKVVAYSIKPFEKQPLVEANKKKHEITFISNSLNIDTASFAEGKDAALVFVNDDVSAPVIRRLADLGVKFIATRSAGTDHIDKMAAALRGIKLANVPAYSPEAIAEHAVALALALNRRLITADQHGHNFDFRLDDLVGFNLKGKTVGLIGLGHIGMATAKIFNGFGCRVIGYDIAFPGSIDDVEEVSLDELYAQADIISLHLPLTTESHYLINADAILKMKDGVMLLNTSRGGLINTNDALYGIYSGKIGYLGLDVYENEKGLFFYDHQKEEQHDQVMTELLKHPNVLITPHQAFLTKEALEQIAAQTIANLDLWQQEKCVGKACVCGHKCKTAAAVQSEDHYQVPLP